MALISCPECTNQISDKASVCPKCGFTIKSLDLFSRFFFFIVKFIFKIFLLLVGGLTALALWSTNSFFGYIGVAALIVLLLVLVHYEYIP